MSNKKRSVYNRRVDVGTYKFSYKDLLNIEKIINKHAQFDDYYLGVGMKKPIAGIPYDKTTEDSVKELSKYHRLLPYIRINGHPRIGVEISPLKTFVWSKRIYTDTDIRKKTDKAYDELVSYLKTCTKSRLFNTVTVKRSQQ